jgi:hypothetical protein
MEDEFWKIILPELTKEALEKLLADEGVSLFLDEKMKEDIRQRFKKEIKRDGKDIP